MRVSFFPSLSSSSSSSISLFSLSFFLLSLCLSVSLSLSVSLTQSSNFFCDLISSSNISSNSHWEGWECDSNGLPLTPVCSWEQISCLGSTVYSIDLTNGNIFGTIPSSIGTLSYLRTLYLDENKFYGQLPIELNTLTNLKSIQLISNSFSGEIPNLTTLTKLTSLYLGNNKFNGPLPAQFSQLPQLAFLSLNRNNFTGTIPSEYGNIIRSLTVLDISDNHLTGVIPSSFCRVSGTIYTFGNELVDDCQQVCLEKGCNRRTIWNSSLKQQLAEYQRTLKLEQAKDQLKDFLPLID
jgi:hypothetical protein